MLDTVSSSGTPREFPPRSSSSSIRLGLLAARATRRLCFSSVASPLTTVVSMRSYKWLCCAVLSLASSVNWTAADEPSISAPNPLLNAMAEELDYSMRYLTTGDGARPYFLSYTVTDLRSISVRGRLGAVLINDDTRARLLDVDLRVGDYALDNTHQLRGGSDGGRLGRLGNSTTTVALDNDPTAIKHALWQATDRTLQSSRRAVPASENRCPNDGRRRVEGTRFFTRKAEHGLSSRCGPDIATREVDSGHSRCLEARTEVSTHLRFFHHRRGGRRKSLYGDQRRKQTENRNEAIAGDGLGQHQSR